MRAQTTTVTAAQVRDNFLITGDKHEARQNIFDTISSNMDMEDAVEMIVSIMKDLTETVKADGGNLDDWSPLDRFTWTVKQAFCLGYIRGWGISMEAAEQGFISLFGADSLGCEPGGFIDD